MNRHNMPFFFMILLLFLSICYVNCQYNEYPPTDIQIQTLDNTNRSQIIWMVPSSPCKGTQKINVHKYGIRENEDQKFSGGKEFAIFYQESFGKVPYFEKQNVDKPHNGGLPQNGNIDEHLKEAKKNIIETIPDEDFDGIAVIDIEEFRPNWDLSWSNFRVYRNESIKLAKKRNPNASEKRLLRIAEKEYNEACREFFTRTIRLGRELRPKAKWGYYLFPKCNGDAGRTETDCSKNFQMHNDNLKWLWQESTALFPSMYLHPQDMDKPDFNFAWTGALLMETRRIKKQYCPKCEIHVFTKIEYDAYTPKLDYFYSKENLVSTMDLAMKMNVDSVVIWSTSKNIQKRCPYLSGYVDNTLGPFVQLINRQMDKCRIDKCSNRGECYLNKPRKNPQYFNYQCRCDYPFTGSKCEGTDPNASYGVPNMKSRKQMIHSNYYQTSYNAPNHNYNKGE